MLTIYTADQSLDFKPHKLDPSRQTGAGVAAALGFKPSDYPVVLAILPGGELESVRPEETVTIDDDRNRFIVVTSDRLYRLSIDGVFFEWVCRVISAAQLRKLGQIDPAKALYLEKVEHPDVELAEDALIDLDAAGVETFRSRARTWKLEVQGVTIVSTTPTIAVRLALQEAGFDPNRAWQILLVVKGKPKEKITIDAVVDLTLPGIEKIRLSPDTVGNAEAAPTFRRDFVLSAPDESHLNRLGLRWETVLEGGRRFVCIHDYPAPPGFTLQRFLLALEMQPSYPQSAIYGFFSFPALALASGRAIPNVSQGATIYGQHVTGWSRQRIAPPWDPAVDCIQTHLMTVDACMAVEVEA